MIQLKIRKLILVSKKKRSDLTGPADGMSSYYQSWHNGFNFSKNVSFEWFVFYHIEGFVQDCSNSILAILQEKKKLIILNIHSCSSLVFELYNTF